MIIYNQQETKKQRNKETKKQTQTRKGLDTMTAYEVEKIKALQDEAWEDVITVTELYGHGTTEYIKSTQYWNGIVAVAHELGIKFEWEE